MDLDEYTDPIKRMVGEPLEYSHEGGYNNDGAYVEYAPVDVDFEFWRGEIYGNL